MIIDAHAHFEPGILDLEGVIRRMDEVGIDKAVLISRMTDPPLYKKPGLLMGVQRQIMRSSRLRFIAHAIDRSFHDKEGEWKPWYRKGGQHRAAFRILLDPDNRSIAEAIQRYPERLRGWIFLNPSRPQWKEELEKWRGTAGMVGIKVHPFWHRYPLERVAPAAQEAERYGLPILVHLGFEKPRAVRKFCTRFPALPIIFAHAGVPLYQDLWRAICGFPHTYVDLSSHHVDARIVRDAVRVLGPKRCLFGSDDPYGEPQASFIIRRWIEGLPISSDEKTDILGGNARRVMKI